MKTITYSVVVPCYNEEKNVPLILKRFSEVIKREDIEVILVNNGSTDQSQKVFDELLPLYAFAKLVKVESNQGYGHGIVQGLSCAEGEYIGWTHADMQTDPQDIIRAIELIEKKGNQHDIYVKGHRRGRPIVDDFFTMGMSLFESMFLQTPLYDINAQPNLFPRRFFLKWVSPPQDFALDLYALYLAKKMKLRVIRFDVNFPERIHGESKWNTSLKAKWKFIRRTIDFSVALKKELD